MTPSLLDFQFFALLVLLCLSRIVWPIRHYAVFGALASATLVALASPATFIVIACLTLFYIFPAHRLMRAFAAAQAKPNRLLLITSIAGLVSLLVIYKLSQSSLDSIPARNHIIPHFIALVGFSYFLFRAISFLHIQSILPIDERSPWALLYFFLFPPTLTSGPIQKYQDFKQQLSSPAPFTIDVAGSAIYRITRGYFRKLFLAGSLNSCLDVLLVNAGSSAYVSIAIVTLLYLYFYFDFAGYSDIAIGLGSLLGIRVPENFRRPFLATSLTEFWRNWHITLVDWFRDQVFIPLGGLAASRLRAGLIAFLIMVLCGLWHGITYSFLLWGIWHGMILFVEAVSGSKPQPPSRRHGWNYWMRVLWTNARVAIAAVLFLPDSTSSFMVLRGFARWI
jgi:alginate O-acetyltransferase complex protein AlgI